MKRILLDTHALVWLLTDPERLGPVGRELLSDRSNPVLVSAATAWEMSTKVRTGRWPEAAPIVDLLNDHVDRIGASELPVSLAHAQSAGSLRWDHQDPFDRMLAAQAMLEHCRLLTHDRAFADLPGLDVLW